MEELILQLEGDSELELVLDGDDELSLILEAGQEIIPVYGGSYEVTPMLTEQILETLGKKMADDLTVHEIPISSTSNPQGGRTILIG